MVQNRIRMRHLRCFLAVAQLGSATRAAEALGTVQPSVSRSLREFEDEMGTPLFDRSAGGLALNEAGRTLFAYVSGGLGQVDRGIETMRGQMGESKVTAFAMPNVVRVVMPGAVRRVLQTEGRETVASPPIIRLPSSSLLGQRVQSYPNLASEAAMEDEEEIVVREGVAAPRPAACCSAAAWDTHSVVPGGQFEYETKQGVAGAG